MPIVRPCARGLYDCGVLEFTDRGIFNGTPVGIDTFGPIDLRIRARRNELARCGIQLIEKSVLVRLHQHAALLPFDRKRGEHQRLRGVVIPIVSWRSLISPHLFAGIAAQRDDGSDVEIVALAAQPVVPRRAIAGTEEYEVQVRIVHNCVPRGSTAACLPPFARPRRCRPAHGLGLERL